MRPVRDRLGGRRPEPPNGPGTCSRCGADVILALTVPHGRVMRVDPRPGAAGAYVLVCERDGRYRVTHHRLFTDGQLPALLWTHHNVTCANPKRPPVSLRPRPQQLEFGKGVR